VLKINIKKIEEQKLQPKKPKKEGKRANKL